MSINEFVEMPIFLCLICFSIYDKMQGFIDESGLFIFLFIFFAFYAEVQGGRQNDFCEKSPVDATDTLWVKYSSKSISLCFRDKHVYAEIQDGRQKCRKNNF